MDRYTAHKIRRERDHLLIEVPGALGPLERKLIKHYRQAGPHLWVIVFRGGTPEAPPDPPPGAWGDDTW
jgi:hypothetical protein